MKSFKEMMFKNLESIDELAPSASRMIWKPKAELVRDAHKAIFKGKWTEED